MNPVQIGCCEDDLTPLFFNCPYCGEHQILDLGARTTVDEPLVCDDCDTVLELLVRRKSA